MLENVNKKRNSLNLAYFSVTTDSKSLYLSLQKAIFMIATGEPWKWLRLIGG